MQAETVTATPGSSIIEAGEQLRDRGLRSLYFFCKAGLGMEDLYLPLHGQVCDFLRSTAKNRKNLRIPRDHLKTSLGNIGDSMQHAYRWLYELEPPYGVKHIHLLITSSTARNAQENFSNEFKERYEASEPLRWWYPEVEKGEIWSEKRRQLVYRDPATGTILRSVTLHYIGVGARVSSGHYRKIYLDDVHAVEEAVESPPAVEDVIRWYRHTDNLLVEPEIDPITVIGTASSFNPPDVYMYIEANEADSFEFMILDVYGGSHGFPSGEPIWPARFPKHYLERLQRKMGVEMFALTMRNNPIDTSVTEWNLDWFPRYYLAGAPESRLYVVSLPNKTRKIYHKQIYHTATLDLSGFRNPKGCANALFCLGRTMDEFNVITHTWKKRCDPDETIDAVRRAYDMVKFTILGIEEVALQELFSFNAAKDLKDLPITIVPVKPHGTRKELRHRAMQPMMKAGQFAIAEGMVEFMDEISRYPKGGKDLIDCWAYQPQVWRLPIYIDDPEEHERECYADFMKQLGIQQEAYQ